MLCGTKDQSIGNFLREKRHVSWFWFHPRAAASDATRAVNLKDRPAISHRVSARAKTQPKCVF